MTTGIPRITGLLVCHNGARWIPGVVRGLRESTAAPQRWVVVDTGSEDGSAALLREGLAPLGGEPTVLTRRPETSYGAAVRAGLEALPPAEPDEWVWLLHDDSAPAPHCFERLVEIVAEGETELVAVGPKQREWPSLKRLLEVGVTVTGTGRRETGLEPGEYDQGQHDEYTAVLAVNTAGMLVRRDVLERFGFAEELPLYGNDLDFGWRVASAGHVIRIVPTAVMFHAEAAHRGQRNAALAARPRRDERVAAMFTVLVNGSPRWHPVRLVRLFLGGLLRALGFLLVRAPQEARAEISALGFVYGHVGRMRSARKARRAAAVAPDSAVTPLLAPFWMPWRHGLDFVVDVGRAMYHVGADSMERRRAGSGQDRPLAARLMSSPSVWGLLAAFAVAVVAGRGLVGGTSLHGGALLPAPGVRHWWSLWSMPWHWVGQGSSAAGPPYTFPLALAGSVLLGSEGAVIWLLFAMTVPLAYLGAVRFFRRLCPGRWTPAWAAFAYALLPVLGGAVGQGRLGTVAVAVLLPWAATAALHLGADTLDRRRRALWRTALGLGVVAAFAPVYGALAIVLAAVLPLLGARTVGLRDRVLLALAPALMNLVWLPTLARAPQAVLIEAGRSTAAVARADLQHLLAGSAAGPGSAPWWLTVGLAGAALLALLRREYRAVVVRCWAVAATAAVLVAAYAHTTLTLPGLVDPVRPYPGALLVLMSGAFITAAAVAAQGLLREVSGVSFGWRQPVAAIAFAAALLAPLGGAAWWLANGTSGPLHRSPAAALPAYLVELGSTGPAAATLVLSGPNAGDNVVRYTVVRGSEARLGDDGLLQMSPPDPAVTAAVSALFGSEGGGAAGVLARHGIAFVYAKAPARSVVAGALDAATGFQSASAPRPRTRAWQVLPRPSLTAVDATGERVRPVLDVLQVLCWIVVLVLAAPTRRRRA